MGSPALERDLRRLVGDRATTSAFEGWFYARDILRLPGVVRRLVKTSPDAVVRPVTADEVAAVVGYCRRQGLPVVPRGGGSSGLFAAVPRKGGVVLDLLGLNQVTGIDADGETVTAAAGATWWQIERELGRHGLTLRSYPSSARSATLGGWLMTSGLGIGSLKHGPVFDDVVSARLALSDSSVREYAAGDGLGVFFESEGGLGVMTEVTLRARRAPESVRHSRYRFDGFDDLARALGLLASLGVRPYNVEFQDAGYLSLLLAAGYEVPDFTPGGGLLLATCDGGDGEVADAEACVADICRQCRGEPESGGDREWRQRFNMLRVRRAAPSVVPSGAYVPVGRVGEFARGLARLRKRPLGAIGYLVSDTSCSLMPMVATDEERPVEYLFALQTPAAVSRLALSLGGKPGGGVGIWNAPFRREILGRSRMAELDAARVRLDPDGIFNPGGAPFLFRPSVYRAATVAASVAGRVLPSGKLEAPRPGFAAELASCVQCGYCQSVCPTAQGWLSSTPRGRVLMTRERFLRSPARQGEAVPEYVDRQYQCTLCGRCGVDCSVDIRSRLMWQGVRGHLAGAGLRHDRLTGLTATIQETHNMAGKDNEQRANWVRRVKLPYDLNEKRTAEVVYFVGCVTSFFPMAQPAARALAQVLEMAGTDFGLVGGQEWCCGFPLMAAGETDAAAACIRHNIARIRDMGARTVVMTCPGCYRVWKEEYREAIDEEHGFEVLHSTELLARLMESGKLTMKGVEASVTYHDPCDLGRNSGIYDQPRYIIDRISGVHLSELPDNREYCSCCGSGGDLLASNQELALDIAARKVDEALATGAETVVTACPSCVRAISMAKTTARAKLGVLDIAELALKAMT